MSKPMDDAQTDARTVTLSDGSVWTLEVSRVSGQWWHRIGDVLQLRLPQLTGQLPLTAADHRKIADVLDPPAALASPRAPESSHPDTHRLDLLEEYLDGIDFDRRSNPVEILLDWFIGDGSFEHKGCVTSAKTIREAVDKFSAQIGQPIQEPPSPDWRDSEAVKVLRHKLRDDDNGNYMGVSLRSRELAYDALCDAVAEYVQSHARPSKGE